MSSCIDDPYVHLQSLLLSQTCWEYRELRQQEERGVWDREAAHIQQRQAQTRSHDQIRPESYSSADNSTLGCAPIQERTLARAVYNGAKRTFSSRTHLDEDRLSKRRGVVENAHVPRAGCQMAESFTMPLRALYDIAGGHLSECAGKRSTWDLFVLILHTSGLQHVTTKAGADVDACTLLVADPTSSFFRITLWRQFANMCAESIRAGDLVRINRLNIRQFRGTMQADSTADTEFRVVWRGDTFIFDEQHRDAQGTKAVPRGVTRGRGWRHAMGRAISQQSSLFISREVATNTAAWAKREFPSVTRADNWEILTQGPGACARSLKDVCQGMETSVRACVLEVSPVKKLWMWTSVDGQSRKDLISRATALLIDDHKELTLQLWGRMASESTVASLRGARVVATRAAQVEDFEFGTPAATTASSPAVFLFTNLRADFSISCEDLVLNTTACSSFRVLPPNDVEAMKISEALARTAAAPDHDEKGVGDISSHGCGTELPDGRQRLVLGGSCAGVQLFSSIADLVDAVDFTGVACLSEVMVRDIDTVCSMPSVHRESVGGIGQHAFVPSVVSAYLGDPDGSELNARGPCPKSGVQTLLRAVVDDQHLCSIVGRVLDPFHFSTNRRDRSDVAASAVGVAISLLHGFKAGCEQGERVDVMLACRASADLNGWVIPGESNFRLLEIKPCYSKGPPE